ncbi:hypothetical protein Vadar_032632 [Vaccinium darrowii]|uniref:Uncharacterized protein n=1 Tax=Vaccinium darrowii TaxID=229202 RepID=A0ACB7Y3E8_9ERIC|nr:hypothetical protein Vadar_032632 [Vaccinium darrowii]
MTLFLLSKMGKHQHHPHTVSRFFPSPFGSCRYRTVSDIIENSIIPITTLKSIHPVPTHPFIKNKPKKGSAISKTGQIDSGLKGRRYPPLTPISPLKSSNHKSDVSAGFAITKNSSSSHSGWFSSEGEQEEEGEIDGESDEFYSLSSDSSISSRRKIRSGSGRRGKSRGSQMVTCPFEVSAISARSSICRETGKSEGNPCRKNDCNSQETPTPRRKRGESRGSDMDTCPSEASAISADASSICRGSRKVEANSGREIGSFNREMHKNRRRRGESRGSETGSCAFEESAISADSGSIGKMNSKSRSKAGGTSRETGKCSRGIVEGADCLLLQTEYEGRKRYEIPTSTIRKSATDSTNSLRISTKSFRGIERDRSYQLMGQCPIVMGDGRVKQSYAVEKTTSDPYSDFKESMVDMILEKDIFEDEDLEKLLHCFLSLNSSHHHNVILQVFAEISEAFCSIKSE